MPRKDINQTAKRIADQATGSGRKKTAGKAAKGELNSLIKLVLCNSYIIPELTQQEWALKAVLRMRQGETHTRR